MIHEKQAFCHVRFKMTQTSLLSLTILKAENYVQTTTIRIRILMVQTTIDRITVWLCFLIACHLNGKMYPVHSSSQTFMEFFFWFHYIYAIKVKVYSIIA